MSIVPDPTQRSRLIEAGARMFHERGYTATGVRQVAAAAEVPVGSFTNHFRSKEGFGLAVLRHYVDDLDRIMEGTLSHALSSPARRVQSYFDAIERALERHDWGVGCLIPDMAGEAPAHSELLRKALEHVLERQTNAFADALRELVGADQDGDLAAVLLAAWHGSLLRMKVERTGEPIRRFRRVLDRMLANWQYDVAPFG